MNTLFLELTIVLVIAGGIACIVSFFKQPSILAYILTGLILGPFGYYKLHQGETLESLAQIGTTLLLFMVGLELNVSELRRIGKSAIIAGIGQILITSSLGFLIAHFLGFSNISSLYIGIAITFSSTIIVVKLLNDKHDMGSLYGRLVVGIFLMQDFVALLILMSLSSSAGPGISIFENLPWWQHAILTLTKGLTLALFIGWLSAKIFPKISKFFAKSDELLLIFSLAWALGFAAFVTLPVIGFSLEIGGFIAGLTLARTNAHHEISARIRSLRDFFIIIFFIVLGSQLVISDIAPLTVPSIILSSYVLIGNPLIVLALLGWLGYKPRTSFFSAVTVGQISEFSLIMVALGVKLGHIGQNVATLVTMIGIITIALSSYIILYAEKIYHLLSPWLEWFDFRKGFAEKNIDQTVLNQHVVLLGAHRLGEHVAQSLIKNKEPFLVVDYDPEIIERYKALDIPVLCGDITDPYIQDLARLESAKLIISTLPDINDNLVIIDRLREKHAKTKLIVTAKDESDALNLYEKNIDYVLLPHFIGSLHLTKIISESKKSFHNLRKLKDSHLKVLHRHSIHDISRT